MTLSTQVVCASLNYQRLDRRALEHLKSAELGNDSETLRAIQRSIGFETESLAVIKKCNAIMMVISYTDDLSEEYVRGRLLECWDSFSHTGISAFKRDIRFCTGLDAIRFLAECATGLHSVTIGDSQVLSQISEGLRSDGSRSHGFFSYIADWLSGVAEECRLKTDIFKGNTSLERIACELLTEQVSRDSTVVVLGHGKSGKLVTKIINQENNFAVTLVNRTVVEPQKEGYDNKVSYSSFNSFSPSDKVGAVVVTLTNTPETHALVSDLLNKIPHKTEVIFFDLSTPSLLTGKIEDFTGVQHFSEISQKTIGSRKDEATKVRKIIEQQIPIIADRINRHFATLYVQRQKNVTLSLDKERIALIEKRSALLRHSRELLVNEGYIEVITPFIVGISTDPPKVDKGGTIDVDWNNGARAFLRQSNQIYKQICVASGIEKMYEIGPFWRRETHESYRHLQESIGLDVELQNPNGVYELYELACTLIRNLNDHMVSKHSVSNHLCIPPAGEVPVLTYHEAVDLLRENGHPITRGDDFGLVSEAKLGQIIKKKSGSDVLVIKDYPDTIKKFYTKRKDNGLTETFDVIVDGWELVSGAVRETNGSLIRKSMQLSDINPSEYEFYIGIVDGAVEHGGFCLGLDRLLAKILNKEMVSDAVPFPRTYKKLIP